MIDSEEKKSKQNEMEKSSRLSLLCAINRACQNGFGQNAVFVAYENEGLIPESTKLFIRNALNSINI